jgi:hypothetical protein
MSGTKKEPLFLSKTSYSEIYDELIESEACLLELSFDESLDILYSKYIDAWNSENN